MPNQDSPIPPSALSGGQTSGRIPCAELQRGQRVDQVFLVEESNFKQTRNGKYFIQLELRDGTGSIRAIRWEASREIYESFAVDDFIRVLGRVEEFQQHLQIIIDALEPRTMESVDLSDFLPRTEKDIPRMMEELRSIVGETGNPFVRRLLQDFLEDPEVRSGLPRCPAGKSLHHAYIGGLLEHILSLACAARRLAPNYPQIDGDLLVAGALLHDIGKLRELSFSGSFRYTDHGQLVGHIPIGITWVKEKAEAIEGFPQDLRIHLEHIIASHHGLPEYGAVKPPMTAEAMAFHHLDDMDAKLASLETIRKEQKLGGGPESRWSLWNPALGRRLYFPGGGNGETG